MTFYYQTSSWNSQPQPNEATINFWKHLSDKKHWRIVQLPNGFFQTEYHQPEKEDTAIDSSVDHYAKKVDFLKGPKVVKTFK